MSVLEFKKLPPALKEIKAAGLTGMLLARRDEQGGVLIFKEGNLIHARMGPGLDRAEGDAALYSLLSWEEGQLKWQPGQVEATRTIDTQQESEFMEAVEDLTNFGSFENEAARDTMATFLGLEVKPAERPSLPTIPAMPAAPDPLPALPPAPPAPKARLPIMPTAPEPYPAAPRPAPNPPRPPVNVRLPEPTIRSGTTGNLPGLPAGGNGPAVSTLIQMGVPRLAGKERFSLNSHFANVVYVAREIADRLWPQVIQASQLSQFLYEDPPANDERSTPIQYLSQLNYGFEQTFGNLAPAKIREWGRVATERSIKLRKASGREQRLIRLLPGKYRKVTVLLNSFVKSMDDIRGEHLHTWKQIDQNQYWLVHYNNLYALGRRRPQNSCYVWTASFEAMLNWAGIGDEWSVEEIECGCVTGTYDCVFAIRAKNP